MLNDFLRKPRSSKNSAPLRAESFVNITFLILYRVFQAGVYVAKAGIAALRPDLRATRALDMQRPPRLKGNVHLDKGLDRASQATHSNASSPLIPKHPVQALTLSLSDGPNTRENILIRELLTLGVEVRILSQSSRTSAANLVRTTSPMIAPHQVLGRESVDLDIPAIAKAYAGRIVMVTGAGGSIGAEICRQLINCKPARIVLFERGEFELYSIDKHLKPLAKSAGIPISNKLGSVTNKARVTSVLKEENVEIVIHAAAYKHVPLVEENEIEGARNNVLGTQIISEAAADMHLERFVLVSTDKAVRPANIMGATKRMAEMVVQDLQTRSTVTKFSMVRFGNVLGSSGSVLPLFQEQIAAGGPVTVTHPDITRYFMTITEAARLVLLAGAYATGGDVFVLDMGKPQKIMHIARRMIKLAGQKVKDPISGQGDIAIEITGLRPGEKLYEELLVDCSKLTETEHPKILRAEEYVLSQIEVASMLRDLQAALADGNAAALRQLIAHRVDGYHTQTQISLAAG